MDKEAMGSIRGILPAMDSYYPFETASPVLSRDFELDNPETSMMGNILSDMFSNQFLYGSNRRIGQEKFGVPELLQFPDQGAKVSFLQMLEGGEGGREECIGYDPFYLKLPVLEEQPDQKGSVKPCKSEPGVEEGKNASIHIVSSEKKAEEPANSGVTEQVLVCDNPPAPQCSSGNENNQRPKRKRAKSSKNSEEVESQRQTHIAVERNRRKQMNEHLNVLRSLMPGSYVQRGDQASIIGGAIEFVKELEQLLQCLQAQKRRRLYAEAFSPKQTANNAVSSAVSSSISSAVCAEVKYITDNCLDMKECIAEIKSEIADVEVKMLGSEALVKILSQKRPGQLLKAIAALESLYLSVLHTNVTTIEQTVLYSFNLKIGVECRLSVDEMASAVQQIFTMIHRGACIS